MSEPKVFANKVIRMLAKSSIPGGREVEDDEYMAIRMVFRRMGGSWESFVKGDPQQMELLKTVVKTWSQIPGRHYLV